MNFTEKLLNWYNTKNTLMPWRGEKDLYKIWLSEIMLQQTQIKTVIPYYNRWLLQFPTISSVAKAKEEKILKYWEGLGYYARARNFHQSCKSIMKKYNGKIPKSEKIFSSLKGVGPYTLAAVHSIGLNKKLPAIDGNVKRVVSRFLGLKKTITSVLPKITDFVQLEINSISNPGDFNQALMDLGRMICKPKKPNCNQCPIQHNCKAFEQNLISSIPFIKKKKKIPHYRMDVGMIWKDGKFLLGKRISNEMLGGMWEMPGFLIDLENSKYCIKQLLMSKSGINVKKGDLIASAKHAYSHFTIQLRAFNCQYLSGKPSSETYSNWKWITENEYNSLPIHKANHKLFNLIFKNYS